MPLPHAGELAALATALCWDATPLAFEAAGRQAILFGHERVGVGGALGALLAVGGVGLLFL